MSLLEIQSILRNASIEDVLLTGFIDRNETPTRFYASLGRYYFELGDRFLSFGATGSSGRALLSVASKIDCDLDLDDDMEFAVTSVKQSLLRDPDGSNRITRLCAWNDEDGPSGVECSAGRIDLSNNQLLFLDRSYHFGIRIGGQEQYESWVENALNKNHRVRELTGSFTPT